MGAHDTLRWAAKASLLEPLVQACERASGPAGRRFALDRLERAVLAADPGTTHALIERLRALGVSTSVIEASALALPPHAVHVPLVVHGEDAARALVRAVIVSYDPSDTAGLSLGPVAARAVRQAIAAAAKDAPPGTALERLRLLPVQPAALDGVEIEGPSLGAAAYLSARALFSGRRVRSGLAVTGALEGRAIVHVEGLRDKVSAARERGLVLLAPAADVTRPEQGLEGVGDLEKLVERALEPGAVDADVEAEVRAMREHISVGWNGYRWPSVRETIARTLVRVPDRRPDLRVEVLARLAAAERHLGRTQESLRCVEEAEAILATPSGREAVPDEPRTRLARQKAMTLLLALSVREARREARRSVAIARRARLRAELIASLGAEGLCAMAARAPRDATELFTEALALTALHRPSDMARSRAYLIEALGAAGDAREAAQHYAAALHEAEDDARRGRSGKIEWVRTSYAAALLAMGQHAEVLEVLDHPSVTLAIAQTPLPGLRARRYLALATVACASGEREIERGLVMLESSPEAYDGLEHGLRVVAHVNVLFALRHRIARGEAIDEARLETSLASLPPSVARVSARVRRSRGASRVGALDALLTRVERA